MPSSVDSASKRSSLVHEALSVARRAHAGQVRNTGAAEIPFAEHPIAVAELLLGAGHRDEVVAAGLLHDVVEHAGVAPATLRRVFGREVASLVWTVTEEAGIEDYEERKHELRVRVAVARPEARALFAADKTANVVVLRGAYTVAGESVDSDLPVSLDRKILVWEYDLEMLFERSPGDPLVSRFASEMIGLWAQRSEEERASLF